MYVLLFTNIGSKVGRKYMTIMEKLKGFSNLINCDIATYVCDLLDGCGILLQGCLPLLNFIFYVTASTTAASSFNIPVRNC